MTEATISELRARHDRFSAAMDKSCPGWELCALVGSMNLYYFTGTICDGALIIRRGAEPTLWVKRSYDRSKSESPLPDVRPLSSFRDVAEHLGDTPDTLYLDMANASLEWYAMLTKYVKFAAVLPADKVALSVRSVKSAYELDIMREAGKRFEHIVTKLLPPMLRDNISEADLCAELYAMFVRNGHHGLSRFSMRNADVMLGHICFGESALAPSVFNGASGIIGLGAYAPILGSRRRYLMRGDLIYVDVGYGDNGYNLDKTIVFSFRRPQPDYVAAAHQHCLELEELAASRLVPGAKPSEIYEEVTNAVKAEYRPVFMGAEGRTVKFIGHGVGLQIDETPVIAYGFDEPLVANMTIALEPKMGLAGVGMVGSENTYLVTERGGVSLTGARRDIILLD